VYTHRRERIAHVWLWPEELGKETMDDRR